MERLSIGIDASGDSVSVCALRLDGTLVGEVDCSSSPPEVIQQLTTFSSLEGCIVGIEAGGCSTFLARALRQAGYEIRVLEAYRANGFLKLAQNKTDKNDACGIAEIIRVGGKAVPDVLLKAHDVQALRSELVLRHRIMVQRIALENALRGTLRLNGGKIGRVSSGTQLERIIEEELERLRLGGVDIKAVVSPAAGLLVQTRRVIESSTRRLERRASTIDACSRLMTIPGVGSICAISFYTAVEDPHRFADAGDVGPYLGLVPRIAQSGAMLRSGRISRMGNTMTRTHLVTAATSMMRQADKDSDLRRWAMKIADRSGRGKARVALARKLAVVMISMWKSGSVFTHERSAVGQFKAPAELHTT